MKKVICLMLCAVMLLALCGCGYNNAGRGEAQENDGRMTVVYSDFLCSIHRDNETGVHYFCMPKAGVCYAPFPGLGIESEKRRNLDSLDDYNNLFADYRQTVPYREKELERLYRVFEEEGRIALMCIRDCAGCKYFVKYYGNKNRSGERTVSNYWCVKKNGFIRSFPKKCLFKPKEE